MNLYFDLYIKKYNQPHVLNFSSNIYMLLLFILYLIHLITYACLLFLLNKSKLMFNSKCDYIIYVFHEKCYVRMCTNLHDNILHINFIHNSKHR